MFGPWLKMLAYVSSPVLWENSWLFEYVLAYVCVLLTHISLASFLWDIGNQCRPRSDATKRGI